MDGILVLEVNGKRFEVGEVEASTTLLEFLRTRTPFKSVKLGCGEGACGACVVLLTKYDPVNKQTESFSVSSCLTLLCSVNGYSITTSEGLGNSKDGFHPIHKRFAGFHATQCGFCTPGYCMSLFSELANAEKKRNTQAPPGFSKLTVSESEEVVRGNLCRCTGYRPIADACKSFAADVDLEDLGINCFWKKDDQNADKAGSLPPYDPKVHVNPYIELEEEFKTTRILNPEKYSWYSPATVEELQALLNAENDGTFKLVVGNTSISYFKETHKYDKYIDLRYIPELSQVKKDESGIEFGAALPISKVILHLKEESESKLGSDGAGIYTRIADQIGKIGSGFIRNSASIGGNLVMAQRKYFPSDIATLLLAVGSSVSLLTGANQERITFEEFLNRPPLDPKDVLLSVRIPFPEPSNQSNSRLIFEAYRVAALPIGHALAYLNAAFLADVFSSENGTIVNRVQLAFGAYETKHAARAKGVEEYLTGKTLSVAVLDEAVKLIRDAIVSEDATPSPDYRKSLAVSFLFSFFIGFINNGGSDIIPPPLSSATQYVEPSSEYYPVGQPIPKTGAAIQASGEAVFVDDIPSPPNCLYGALLVSTIPQARVKNVSFTQKTGIVDVISVKDVPKGGENFGGKTLYGEGERLFVDDVSEFAGDIIAFVVAESQKQADIAAATAVVDYDTEGLDPPILTVEQAVEKSSLFDIPDLMPVEVGDFEKGMAEADHQILSTLSLGSQYFFYMESSTALAIPDEDNCMVVHSSTKFAEYAHTSIARCLGVPEHNVRVITRRLGGGFGGKAVRSMNVATACALAAHKLRLPVRSYVNRKTDMIVAGGRHPMKIKYNVGFKSNGKITALHLDVKINAGISSDLSPLIPNLTVMGVKKYNWGALSFDIKLCKMNHTSKTTMRGPGHAQGTYIADAIIDRVASELSMDPDSVREINFHTYESLKLFYDDAPGDDPTKYTLRSIWDRVARTSDLEQRIASVKEFNRSNLWHKRGISRVPIVQLVSTRVNPGIVSILFDGSVVVQVGGIEWGQGLWTKVKQVAAYALSLVGCDGTDDLVDRVRVVESNSLGLPQGGITGGSTTSEISCAVTKECCDILVERLAPLVKEQHGSVTWDHLIQQAHSANVNLTAHSFFVPKSPNLEYLNYGAAVSEVQVNVLTGETTNIRTDIIYDCGQSMNPAVDLGQMEGGFVQGMGFYMLEDYSYNEEGLQTADSTWTYKIPTFDTIPKQFNLEVLNTGHHKDRILSSKTCGEAPLILAVTILGATRAAIIEARKQLKSWGGLDGSVSDLILNVPATVPTIKQLCGLNTVEAYLQSLLPQS